LTCHCPFALVCDGMACGCMGEAGLMMEMYCSGIVFSVITTTLRGTVDVGNIRYVWAGLSRVQSERVCRLTNWTVAHLFHLPLAALSSAAPPPRSSLELVRLYHGRRNIHVYSTCVHCCSLSSLHASLCRQQSGRRVPAAAPLRYRMILTVDVS
jgi:hypothetical protein